MNESYNRRELRWIAVRLFITPPAVFGIAGVVFLISEAGAARSGPFLAQVAAGLLAVAATAYSLTPVFARLCRRSVVAGCVFGVVVCAVGGMVFGITAVLGYPDFSFRAYVLRPLFWFALCGFPAAAITGLLFSGAAQRLS
jgi:hypothetical protein